mmetsp:Transcript_42101/g.134521  ORF Transcript_42101/g.134521 Transcript_42101/m.134521 type:complete len:270 (+) Transcript_42101:1261-2070(+)
MWTLGAELSPAVTRKFSSQKLHLARACTERSPSFSFWQVRRGPPGPGEAGDPREVHQQLDGAPHRRVPGGAGAAGHHAGALQWLHRQGGAAHQRAGAGERGAGEHQDDDGRAGQQHRRHVPPGEDQGRHQEAQGRGHGDGGAHRGGGAHAAAEGHRGEGGRRLQSAGRGLGLRGLGEGTESTSVQSTYQLMPRARDGIWLLGSLCALVGAPGGQRLFLFPRGGGSKMPRGAPSDGTRSSLRGQGSSPLPGASLGELRTLLVVIKTKSLR